MVSTTNIPMYLVFFFRKSFDHFLIGHFPSFNSFFLSIFYYKHDPFFNF